MTFQNYTNNVQNIPVVNTFTDITGVIILGTGLGDLLPSTNGRVTVEMWNTYQKVIKREVIDYLSRSGDTLSGLTRSVEACVQDDTMSPRTRTQNTLDFTPGTGQIVTLAMRYTEGNDQEIKSQITGLGTSKLSVSDYISGAKLYDDSTTGTDAYVITITGVTSYAQIDGQSFRVKVDVDNTDSATLNINSLGAKNIRKYGGDPLLTGDIVAGQIIEVIWNNYANAFELSSVIDASGAISSDAQVVNFSLGYTGTSTDFVSIDVSGKIQKAVVDGSVVGEGFSGILLGKQTVALSSTSFVTLARSNTGLIQTVVGSISSNVITYGSVNSFTPTNWSAFRGTPNIVKISSTSFVVSWGYSWFLGGNIEFLQSVAYTVSGTTITRGSTLTITNNTTQQVVLGACYVASNKYMISYTASTSTIVACTVSGTTITAGMPVSSLSIAGTPSYVSDDKVVITDGSNARLYTFSGTTPTQGNSLSLGATYTSYAIKDIGSSKQIFTGTNSTNTIAFIIDSSTTTPTKGSNVTVLASSTSTDCVKAGDTTVLIVTGGNKYYYYTYAGTTLNVLNNETKTNSISINNIDFLGYMQFITSGQVVGNLKKSLIGGLKQAGVLNDVRPVVTSGVLGGFSSLIPGSSYYLNGAGISTSGDVYVGKAKSTTELYIAIPHSTL